MPHAQDREPRGERSPSFFPSRHRTHRAKSAAASRASLRVHIEHLRQKPSPRDPVSVLAVLVVVLHDLQLHRLRQGGEAPPLKASTDDISQRAVRVRQEVRDILLPYIRDKQGLKGASQRKMMAPSSNRGSIEPPDPSGSK